MVVSFHFNLHGLTQSIFSHCKDNVVIHVQLLVTDYIYVEWLLN
jgi:hypothetical protein